MVIDRGIPTGLKMQGSGNEFRRFQISLISLEKGRYSELEDDRFVTSLAKYLFELYRCQYFDFAHGILHILGNCAVCPTPAYREKALFILTLFAENAVKDGDDLAVQALSWIFSRWLRQEGEYLGCFEHVCKQIQALLRRMLGRGQFCQLTIWDRLFTSVVNGEWQRRATIQAVVRRMRTALVQEIMKYDPASPGLRASAEDIECLRRFRSENSAESLVEELYTCSDKERRLAIISSLSKFDGNVAYVLLEKLGANAAWYAIRNAVQIISQLKGTRHFSLVKPFLQYPDKRVQQQVIDYISRLDREKALDQLIWALEVCDDSLKPGVVRELSATGRKSAGRALLRLLNRHASLNPAGRDALLLLLCSELQHFPTQQVVNGLRRLVAEREASGAPAEDPIIRQARETIAAIGSL